MKAAGKVLVGNHHMGYHHQLVAGEVPPGGDDIHHLAALKEHAVEPLHLPLHVQKEALLLDAEGGQGVVVIEHGNVAVDGCGEHILILFHAAEKRLRLKKAAAGHIVRVQKAVAELLGTLGGAAVAEVEKSLAAPRHGLPRPHLGLVGTGQEAGDVVPLGAHDGLGHPEVLPLQAADVVEAKGDFAGRQWLLLAAPDGIVVVGHPVEARGHSGVVHVLS